MATVNILDVLTEKYKGKQIELYQIKCVHKPQQKVFYHYYTKADSVKYYDDGYFTDIVQTKVVATILRFGGYYMDYEGNSFNVEISINNETYDVSLHIDETLIIL